MKAFWGLAGAISLGLGLLGIVLPLVPTVPFILLAAFCFSRSSRRLHDWLTEHRIFGPMITDWQDRGAISAKSKRAATVAVAVVFTVSVALMLPIAVLAIQSVTLGAVMLFIWTRPAA